MTKYPLSSRSRLVELPVVSQLSAKEEVKREVVYLGSHPEWCSDEGVAFTLVVR